MLILKNVFLQMKTFVHRLEKYLVQIVPYSNHLASL